VFYFTNVNFLKKSTKTKQTNRMLSFELTFHISKLDRELPLWQGTFEANKPDGLRALA